MSVADRQRVKRNENDYHPGLSTVRRPVDYYYDALGREIGRVERTYEIQASGSSLLVGEKATGSVHNPTGLALEIELDPNASDGKIVRRYLHGPAQAGLLAIDQTDPITDRWYRTVPRAADDAGRAGDGPA